MPRVHIEWSDYNHAETLLATGLQDQWADIRQALASMPLFVKESDQKNKKGILIFDPKGSNAAIKNAMQMKHWISNCRVPDKYRFLGSDVDFFKNGLLVEVQFSNYPFLLNNLIRAELFLRSQIRFHDHPMQCMVIVTKDGRFPASNSTLYYNQAKNMLDALVQESVFVAPIRLVNLSAHPGSGAAAIFTEYTNPRYSREPELRRNGTCDIATPQREGGKWTLMFESI